MAFLAPLAAGFTASGLGTALGAASAAIGAVGAISSARSQKAASDYNAKLNENNAKIAQDQAAAKASELSVRNRQKLAAVRAGSAENGLEISGSVTDVLDTVAKQGALDQLTAIYEGTTRAMGFRNSANLDRMRGKSAMTEGAVESFTSIFDGFSRAFA